MKMLVNFQVGKPTQERMVIERFLVGQQLSLTAPPESVHAVVSVIQEKVDCTIHSHVQL